MRKPILFACLCLWGTGPGCGDPDVPATCGDGALQTDEPCEGFDVREVTCEELGYQRGRLACTDTCQLDTSGCSTCGDGAITGDEVCEPDDVGGATCLEETGEEEGELACALGCLAFDTSACGLLVDDALIQKLASCNFVVYPPDCVGTFDVSDARVYALYEAYLTARVTSSVERDCVLGLDCGTVSGAAIGACLWQDEGGVPEYEPSCSNACLETLAACGTPVCGVDEVVACEETYLACLPACTN